MNNNFHKKGFVDDQHCDTCGLQKLKIVCETTGVLQIEAKQSHCLVKSKIASLHEQILGCKQNDEDAKPRVPLNLINEFFESKTFKDFQEDHKCLLDIFFDEDDYKARSLPKLKPIKKINFVYVETKEELQIMLEELKKFKEIAVNLEYYSRRSYLGFSWLLQISTEDKYYMINCIKLQKDLHILNAIFMELEVMKIFHDGEDAVFRLNKDFGIFVTNMFDTAILRKIIRESHEEELLQKNLVLEADKVHAHFLIFLKTYLTNFSLKSHKKKFLKTMRQSCKRICENVDHKANWNKLNLNNLPTGGVTIREKYVAMRLLEWRDQVARRQDESPNFILPDNDILKVARELFQKNTSTLSQCYGALFMSRRETFLNIEDIIFKAMQKSNKGKNLQFCLDDSNNQSIGIVSDPKNSENSEEKPQRSKSQKKSKQEKLNQLKRVPKFW